MWPRCGPDTAQMWPRCGPGVAQVWPRCGRGCGRAPCSFLRAVAPSCRISGSPPPLQVAHKFFKRSRETLSTKMAIPLRAALLGFETSRGPERTREDPRGPEMTPRRHLDRPPTGSANLGYISANLSATSRRHLGDISTGCLPARAQAQDGPRLGGSHREIAERQPRDSREVAEIAGLRGAQLLPAATRETRLPSSADEPPPRRAAGTAEGGRGRR